MVTTPYLLDPQLPTPCGGRDILLFETVVAWEFATSTVDGPHITDEAGFGCNLLLFSTYIWLKTKLFKYISKTSFSWDTDRAPAAWPLFFKRPWKSLKELTRNFLPSVRLTAYCPFSAFNKGYTSPSLTVSSFSEGIFRSVQRSSWIISPVLYTFYSV